MSSLEKKPMLVLENVKVRYDTIEVLHNINLHVNKGEIVAIIGANGAGKSTTFRAITGLVPTTKSSHIFFEGQEITGLDTTVIVKRGISLVPEGRRIFPDLTVRENLEMGAYLHMKDKNRLKQDMNDMFALFPRLQERSKQAGKTLSGGELQMLAIARALMTRPRLLMLDEPSTGLAPLIVKDIFTILQNIRENGTTILLVEQNARLTLSVADRGYVLKNGEIVMEDTGKNLLNNEEVQKAYLGEKTYRKKG